MKSPSRLVALVDRSRDEKFTSGIREGMVGWLMF